MKVPFLIMVIVMFLTGCLNAQDDLKSPGSKAAHDYLREKGFLIDSYEGERGSYQLTKANIKELPHMMEWGYFAEEGVDPELYFNRNIQVEHFIVKDHPRFKKKAHVAVFLADNEPIGATSVPWTDEEALQAGWVYSLDGQTLEEVQPLPYPEWMQAWSKRYR
ncbi:hypothetical protein SY83_10395 [Paenibacillus swuensis]|uniref:DUF4830 domain-containing protein n=2 Tax=Paenibacillus swuensis TaxID=1178515 RepID=A0A172TP36_9BACL|nr:hypothetical protein SY83_10395 [Paenibacillus swuensis]